MVKIALNCVLVLNIFFIVTCSNPSSLTWEINSKLLYPEEGVLMDNNRTGNDSSDVLLWYFEWVGYSEIEEYHLFVKHSGAKLPVIDVKTIDRWYSNIVFRFYIGDDDLEGWNWKIRAKTQGVWSTWTHERVFRVEPPDTDSPSTDIKELYKELKKTNDTLYSEQWGLDRGLKIKQ